MSIGIREMGSAKKFLTMKDASVPITYCLEPKSDRAGWITNNVTTVTNIVNRYTDSKQHRKDNFDLIKVVFDIEE